MVCHIDAGGETRLLQEQQMLLIDKPSYSIRCTVLCHLFLLTISVFTTFDSSDECRHFYDTPSYEGSQSYN